jgi:hypothetical protein
MQASLVSIPVTVRHFSSLKDYAIQNVNNNMYMTAVFFDIEKGFDTNVAPWLPI